MPLPLILPRRLPRFRPPTGTVLPGSQNPFVSREFLAALEDGGATGGDSGWDPMHLLLRDSEGRLAAAMPQYLKHHSYGEYIFDHSSAHAFMRAAGD